MTSKVMAGLGSHLDFLGLPAACMLPGVKGPSIPSRCQWEHSLVGEGGKYLIKAAGKKMDRLDQMETKNHYVVEDTINQVG